MTIYTKTGDGGETSLFGGHRVKKYDAQIEAYGVVDELSSYIGLVSSQIKNKKDKLFLIDLQKDLYQIMSFLSGASADRASIEKRVVAIEKKIDSQERILPKLTRFILPGGTTLSSWFHILRVVCRRAERLTVKSIGKKKIANNERDVILQYLNRLSDLFFIMARKYGRGKEIVT